MCFGFRLMIDNLSDNASIIKALWDTSSRRDDHADRERMRGARSVLRSPWRLEHRKRIRHGQRPTDESVQRGGSATTLPGGSGVIGGSNDVPAGQHPQQIGRVDLMTERGAEQH